MSDLIPVCSWDDFVKIGNAGKIAELKACEVKVGDFTFTAEISHGDYIAKDYVRTQAEYLGVKANISGGEDPETILHQMVATATEKYPHLVKARATRQANVLARKHKEIKNALPV